MGAGAGLEAGVDGLKNPVDWGAAKSGLAGCSAIGFEFLRALAGFDDVKPPNNAAASNARGSGSGSASASGSGSGSGSGPLAGSEDPKNASSGWLLSAVDCMPPNRSATVGAAGLDAGAAGLKPKDPVTVEKSMNPLSRRGCFSCGSAGLAEEVELLVHDQPILLLGGNGRQEHRGAALAHLSELHGLLHELRVVALHALANHHRCDVRNGLRLRGDLHERREQVRLRLHAQRRTMPNVAHQFHQLAERRIAREMTILSKDPGRDANQILGRQRVQHQGIQLIYRQTAQLTIHAGISLALREQTDQIGLHRRLDLPSAERKDLRHGVDVPRRLRSESTNQTHRASVPLRELADLVDELLALEVIVGVAQNEQEALNNDIHVLRVAHAMQDMQRLSIMKHHVPSPTELRMEISSLSSAFSTTICRRTTY